MAIDNSQPNTYFVPIPYDLAIRMTAQNSENQYITGWDLVFFTYLTQRKLDRDIKAIDPNFSICLKLVFSRADECFNLTMDQVNKVNNYNKNRPKDKQRILTTIAVSNRGKEYTSLTPLKEQEVTNYQFAKVNFDDFVYYDINYPLLLNTWNFSGKKNARDFTFDYLNRYMFICPFAGNKKESELLINEYATVINNVLTNPKADPDPKLPNFPKNTTYTPFYFGSNTETSHQKIVSSLKSSLNKIIDSSVAKYNNSLDYYSTNLSERLIPARVIECIREHPYTGESKAFFLQYPEYYLPQIRYNVPGRQYENDAKFFENLKKYEERT